MSKILYWFTLVNGNFVRVFGGNKSLHIMSSYATDKLVIEEVVYHISIGLSKYLHMNNKGPSPFIPLYIGFYDIKNLKVTNTKGEEINKFSLCCLDINPYNPQNVCKAHCARINLQWLRRTFYKPEKEAHKFFDNASKSIEPVIFTRKS